jgi:RimJ/RimL family protein N-acetyltransferase
MTPPPIRIRPVDAGDLPKMFEMQCDPESNRLAGTIPRTREAFEAHWAKCLPDPRVVARAILRGDDFVGLVSCFVIGDEDHIGYWIDRPFWGRGIASRAMELLLLEVSRRPLYATAATDNLASLRILQKCGFVVERVHLSPATDRFTEREVAELALK